MNKSDNETATRVVVTGGAGFVGSHLCDRLLERGHRVTCIDDFSTGSRANIAHLSDHPRFELLEHDVTQPYDAACEQLYNLACPASPVHYQRDPIRTLLTNVQGVLNGLRCAQRHGARFLQASTSEVYGDPTVHPQPEEYHGNVNTTGPRACYDEGKRAAETLCADFTRTLGLDTRIARVFNTYGPRMAPDDGRVVSNFIVQALRGAPLTVYGEGSQTRSFCFVSDLVDGLMKLMDHPSERGPVNLGNPGEFTIAELAREVVALVGGDSTVSHQPLPMDDPKLRRPDIRRANERLGFSPTVPLRDGLVATIAYFRPLIAEGEGGRR